MVRKQITIAFLMCTEMSWLWKSVLVLIWKQCFEEMDISAMLILRVTNLTQVSWDFTSFSTTNVMSRETPFSRASQESWSYYPYRMENRLCVLLFLPTEYTRGQGVVRILS